MRNKRLAAPRIAGVHLRRRARTVEPHEPADTVDTGPRSDQTSVVVAQPLARSVEQAGDARRGGSADGFR